MRLQPSIGFGNDLLRRHEPVAYETVAWLGIAFQQFMCLALVLFSFSQLAPYSRFGKFLRIPIVLYFVWAWFFDEKSTISGDRKVDASERKETSWWYETYRNYFPASIVFDFDTKNWKKKPCLFAAWPHGIISHGLSANVLFGTPDELRFIGDYRVAMNTLMVLIPFWRELMLRSGAIAVSKKAMGACLENGRSVFVVPGGAREALLSKPGFKYLDVKQRKGFVKLALRHGVDLVPVYSFGESEMYELWVDAGDQSKYGALYAFQQILKKFLGTTFPLFKGRCGTWLPFRKPLVTVFGKPIEIPHIPDPTTEQVKHWNSVYATKLEELYQKYKPQYDELVKEAEKRSQAKATELKLKKCKL